MTTLRTPPLLIGASLLFWGWQIGLPLLGALLGALIEASRVVGLRWDLTEKDFRRIWDFTMFLFVGVLVYLFASGEGPNALAGFFANASPGTQGRAMQETAQSMLAFFRWLPAIFFLLVIAQAYSSCEVIPWATFSFLLRRRQAQLATPPQPGAGANTAYPYFSICIFASGMNVGTDYWFFAGVTFLVACALWSQRSRRYSPAVWIALLLLSAGVGFVAQRGFMELSNWANNTSAAWLMQFVGAGTDPKESRTALGRLGKLKLSAKIVLRVEPKDNQPVPPLLREASYQFFKFPDWAGAGKIRDFENTISETNATTWLFPTTRPVHGAVTISQFLTRRGQDARRGLLAVPHGIVRLERLGAFVLSTNQLGVVRVDEGPGLITYDAYFASGSTIDAPPDRSKTGQEIKDLDVPSDERPVLRKIVNELQLSGRSTQDILRVVTAYFTTNFEYSTWLPGTRRVDTNLTALGHFLLHERKGHCEYFATAAALLLRQAGIPARYAVGYSVQERSGNKYVVRQRHAHAWCLAWVDGAWHDFDITPGSWVEAEAARASWTERISDGWSALWFEFSRLRWGLTDWRKYLLWFFGPVLLVLLFRLFFGKRWRRLREQRRLKQESTLLPGADSEFYQLEEELSRRSLPREPNETPLHWMERACEQTLFQGLREPIEEILRLHYRHRFDPSGLSNEDRAQLKSAVHDCLRRLRRAGE